MGLLQRTYSKLTPGVTAELSVFSVGSASVGFITHINPDHQLTVHPPLYSSATLVIGKVLRVFKTTFIFSLKMQVLLTNTFSYVP